MRLRYRPFQAVAIATLAALVTACAAFAPLYGRAMQQALTDLAVDRTEQEVVGLQLRAIATAWNGRYLSLILRALPLRGRATVSPAGVAGQRSPPLREPGPAATPSPRPARAARIGTWTRCPRPRGTSGWRWSTCSRP